jgi:hypothetical protein
VARNYSPEPVGIGEVRPKFLLLRA